MKTILQVCAFGAQNAGNFIASLTALEASMAIHGYRTIYAFPEKAREKNWCQTIQKRTDVYFLPEAKARILPKTYQIFRQIYHTHDIFITHSHFELYDIPASVMAPRRVRVFWHLHDALKRNYLHAGYARKLLTRIQYSPFWKRVQMLTVSKEHGHFAATLGFPKQNIHYFPNGIHTDRIQHLGTTRPTGRFLMFGWEVDRKGVDLAVEAARKCNNNIQITIVGQDACREYLLRQGTPATVVYHPPVEDVNYLYSSTSVFLHISRAEGLSYALLEAIYAGLPIICSDIQENMFANTFRNVYFVKSESVDDIAAMIQELSGKAFAIFEDDCMHNRHIIDETYSVYAWCQRLSTLYLEA